MQRAWPTRGYPHEMALEIEMTLSYRFAKVIPVQLLQRLPVILSRSSRHRPAATIPLAGGLILPPPELPGRDHFQTRVWVDFLGVLDYASTVRSVWLA